MTERLQLTSLENRPVFEGDVLFGIDGKALKACRPWRTDFPLRMEVISKEPEDPDFWATGTHWKGQQVLFWRAEDIPAPRDRTLFTRLSEQIEANKKRKEKRARR
ncbi:hypothetical protein [Paraburkholderia caledonica]|uniref:Uncharacterized protein n=1 Tax=Paraburkholderia caledonica TaxID=134536 RepID=A0AB73I8B6_9BURK|nr:hypothetical protein [Paraburkholderia caledonica]